MNSITKRWVRGSLFFTIAILLMAESLFLYFTYRSYHDSVRSSITAQLNTLKGQLTASSSASSQARDVQMRRMVEQFEAKSQFELMLVDREGHIVQTSSGVTPVQDDTAEDIRIAIASPKVGRGEYVGRNRNGESVMAITMRTPYPSDGIVAIRIVTSLELVYKALWNAVLLSIALLLVVVLASVVSGVYFIRSIVFPLQRIEATASRIAKGDFDTRIQNMRDDEIGSLSKTINNMARALGQNERIKNEFISSVSHELRTPLTSIKGWTETVSRIQDPADPNFRRGVGIIAAETDRLYDMVEELLDFSRMQHGMTLRKEKLDLAAEVEEAVLLLQQRANSQNITLLYEAPEEPVAVLADKNRMRQVFVNILDNSIKYSKPGGMIELELETDDDFAQLTVADEGKGIAKEELDNVRIKFYKAKGSVRGSGIGLAVVDEIMHAHDGEMDIESELGKGTRVKLFLPLYKAAKNGQMKATDGKDEAGA